MSEQMTEAQFADAIAAKKAEALGIEPEQAEEPTEEPAAEEPAEEPESPPTPPDGEPPAEEEPQPPAAPAEEDSSAASSVAEAIAEAVDELPEDATEEERQASVDAAIEEFYAGRYRTREEAERGIAEKDATIARLHQERADLHKKVEEGWENQSQELDVKAWEEWAQDQVEEGLGSDGALAALQNGGYEGYQIYLRAWMSDPEQIADATIFNNAFLIEMQAEQAKQVADTNGSPAIDPSDAQAARAIALARRPDLDDWEDEMVKVVDDLDEATRVFLKHQALAGPEGQARALDILYLEARARSGASRAQRIEADRRKTSATAAKVGASVASAEATPARTPLSEAEQRVIRMKNSRREEWGLEPLPEE